MKKSVFIGVMALPILLGTIFMGCDKDEDDVVQSTSSVKTIHASPNAPGVDLLVDNVKVNASALSYPQNTGYLTVNAGTRNIKVNATGTTTTVINADLPFTQDKKYSVFAYDVVSTIKAFVVEDNLANPASGKAHIRFFHLSPGAPDSYPVLSFESGCSGCNCWCFIRWNFYTGI